MSNQPNKIPSAPKRSVEGEPASILAALDRRDSIVIGRDIECNLVIPDTKASRRHCRVTRTGADFIVEDLGSKNGTYVDGQRITGPVTLKPHQVFQIGTTVFFLA